MRFQLTADTCTQTDGCTNSLCESLSRWLEDQLISGINRSMGSMDQPARRITSPSRSLSFCKSIDECYWMEWAGQRSCVCCGEQPRNAITRSWRLSRTDCYQERNRPLVIYVFNQLMLLVWFTATPLSSLQVLPPCTACGFPSSLGHFLDPMAGQCVVTRCLGFATWNTKVLQCKGGMKSYGNPAVSCQKRSMNRNGILHKKCSLYLFPDSGNICRSPMAEGIFLDLIKKKGLMDQWIVDSAAVINFHVGKTPDSRTLTTLAGHGITDYEHRVTVNDFHNFDFIFGMDEENIEDLKNLKGNIKGKAVIEYLGKYDPEGFLVVPDPFYSRGMQLFEKVYEQCLSCSEKMPGFDSRIMYLILRSDLVTDLKWSFGAVVAQAAHAATACIWTFREDNDVVEYMNDIARLRKVTLKVPNESELRSIEKKLQDGNVDYYLWTEDSMAVCIALKPQLKSFIEHHVKHLKLF
uniref:Phosphotyrosine protein phosphatase I domain-containing protein n=1 Tax=Setaria digitata TaxID=48799 RepID=A0A915Q483_9BILA